MNAIFFVSRIRYLLVLYDQYCLSTIPLLSPSSAICSAHQVVYATAVSGCNITWVLKTDDEILVVCNWVKFIVQNFSQNKLLFASLTVQWNCLWVNFFTFSSGKLKWSFTRVALFLHSQLVKTAVLRSPFPLLQYQRCRLWDRLHEEHINAGRTVQVRIWKWLCSWWDWVTNITSLVTSGMDLQRGIHLADGFDKQAHTCA